MFKKACKIKVPYIFYTKRNINREFRKILNNNRNNFKKYHKKNGVRHIVFITDYPSTISPDVNVFVQQLVRAIARTGIKCSVISPVNIFNRKYKGFQSRVLIDHSIKGNPIMVLRPHFLSFSNKRILNYNTFHLTQFSFDKAISSALSHIKDPIDVVYGHFLYPFGNSAIRFAKKLGLTSIVASGESINPDFKKIWSIEFVGIQKAIEDYKNVDGIISVSSLLKEAMQSELRIPERKVKVFPNGVDLNLLYPRNKHEMRKKFNFPPNITIAIFIGHFDDRKGPQRILQAIEGLDNIGIVLIGSGNIPLESEKILFKGTVEHSLIPEVLSSGDMFVLPTLAEGSCNAIIEAMACGLPVITSKGRFNDDIVNKEVAIRVEPLNVNQIRTAVLKIMGDKELHNRMSEEALKWSKRFDVNIRAKNIVEWINKIYEEK